MPRYLWPHLYVSTIEERSASTTLLVSPRTEGLDLLGLEDPEDEILEQPEEHLPMHGRQRASGDGGGKSLVGRQRKRQTVEHKETVSEHDQGQMALPANPV